MAEPHDSRQIGTLIAARRRALGLTQAQLADRLQLESSETVSRYERGEREPRYTTLRRIAWALQTTVERLLPPSEGTTPGEGQVSVGESEVPYRANLAPQADGGARLDWGDARAALLMRLDSLAEVEPDAATEVVTAFLTLLKGRNRPP